MRDGGQGPVCVDGLVFAAPSMRRLVDQLRTVAPLDTTVLFSGETGTGKTCLARLMHQWSPRRSKPFVTIQCGALSPTLVESALFGHVRGAFTGADRDQVGKFAEAKDGTLLLDEVDCLPRESQATLLNAVEDRLFEPVGSTRPQPFRARLVVATNRNLEEEVAAGRFRPDLYHRLNVVGFTLPPLREQREAIRPTAQRFLAQYCSEVGRDIRGLTSHALAALEAYDWPGNFRELRNAIERTVVLCAKPVIDVAELALPIQKANGDPHPLAEQPPLTRKNRLAEARGKAEITRLREALDRHHNNRTHAATELGVSRVTLLKKLRHYGMS